MHRPQSGRNRTPAYDPEDTWDQYMPFEEKSSPLPQEEKATYAAGDPAASAEAIVKAFAHSNAMRALGEEMTPFDAGRKMVRMQHKDSSYDAYNPNILPSPAMRSECVVDDYYLGGLGVEDRFKSGTFVDRLGNEYDVWESQMPPPDKDYSTIAPASSQRHLERCMGADPYFYDRPKKEVSADTNPAEPRGDGFYKKERLTAAELKGRQTFFNQAGMQNVAQFDTGRDNYDGYNIKTAYHERTYPVEPCWRATQSRPVTKGAEPTLPGGKVGAVVPSKRTELGKTFGRTPTRGVSVRAARISLPFVSAATLRAGRLDESTASIAKLSSGFEGARVGNDVTDHNESEERGSQAPVRPALATTVRTNPNVASNTKSDVEYTAHDLNASGPVQFAAALTDVESRELQREGCMVKPKASRDWEVTRRIMQAIDHVTDDDVEISQITKTAMRKETEQPALREGLDHIVPEEVALPSAHAEGGRSQAAQARPGVQILTGDIVRRVDDDRRDAVVHAGKAQIDVTRTGRPDIEANHTRRDKIVDAQPTEAARTRTGRPEVANTYSAKQQTHEQRAYRATVVKDEMREMPERVVDRDVAMPGDRVIGRVEVNGADGVCVDYVRADQATHGTRAHANIECLPSHRQQHAALAPGSVSMPVRVSAVPHVSDERINTARKGPSTDLVVVGSASRAKSDSLPHEDRARVAVTPHKGWIGPDNRLLRGSSDEAPTNRSHLHREARSSAHRTMGDNPRPAVAAKINTEAHAYARTGHGERANAGERVRGKDERPDSARASYGTQMPTRASSTNATGPMRATPIESLALGGTSKISRIESAASHAGPRAFVRGSHNLSDDRSTPTRALTPAMASSARWTPAVQVESNRESCNRR